MSDIPDFMMSDWWLALMLGLLCILVPLAIIIPVVGIWAMSKLRQQPGPGKAAAGPPPGPSPERPAQL
ncbi:MAG TPA: hypothetical protein VFA26_11560 [Gemmataceae bacterium]|nr:hypothetical protein [Gemmataceae bacterium]